VVTPISSYLRDGQGRFDLVVPVTNRPPGPGAAATTVVLGVPGVYPIQVQLRDATGRQLDSVVSAIVRLDPQPPPSRLSVAVVLTAEGPPSHGPDLVASVGDDVRSQVGQITDALVASPATPVAFSGSAELIEAMSQDPSGATIVTRLDAALASRQVLSTTYVPVDGPALVQAGLGSELGRQLVAGEDALRGALPSSEPDRRTAIEDGPLDQATVNELVTLGVNQVVVPAADVAVDASADLQRPFRLRTSTGSVRAATVDPDLQRAFATGLPPAQAATRLYLQLALLSLSDTTGDAGLLLSPPAGATVSAGMLVDLFTLIGGGPLLQAVSLDDYFRLVGPVTTAGQPAVRSLRPASFTPLGSFATTYSLMALQAASFAAVVPDDVSLTRDLDVLRLLILRRELTDASRKAYQASVVARLDQIRAMVRVAGQGTVTLTSSKDAIPYVVSNSAPYPVHVLVRLQSSKLGFPGSTTPGTYDQLIWLAPGTSVNRPQVTTRARATFPLTIEIWSPDGAQRLTGAEVTVRSTALSGVGVVLTIGAATVLAWWWIRNASHRRRAGRARAHDQHPSGYEPTTTVSAP
jgi:hypothetical protein